jgi:ribosome maturation factor RimP
VSSFLWLTHSLITHMPPRPVVTLLLLAQASPLRGLLVPSRARSPIACDGAISGGAMLEGTPFWNSFVKEVDNEASALGLDVREVSFNAGKLTILASGGGLDELQMLNSHLSNFVDAQDPEDSLPPFLLEVSSPGLSNELTSDADFTAFKGFPVVVTTIEPFKSKTTWEGTLNGRTDEHVAINLKGRLQKIPLSLVDTISLPNAKREKGDVE